jgi:hypothetical protein
MRRDLAALLGGLAMLWNAALAAEDSRMIELVVPRALERAERIELQVTVAPLPADSRVLVRTEQGEVLGVVTPFGLRPAASTASIAVPRRALVDSRLRLRLQVQEPGAPARAARENEVSARFAVPQD